MFKHYEINGQTRYCVCKICTDAHTNRPQEDMLEEFDKLLDSLNEETKKRQLRSIDEEEK